MNSFKKIFQKSNDDQTASLKHTKSMPYLLSSEGGTREHRSYFPKPVYRGKTPLKKSDIVYIEQAPGMLEVYHGKLSQHTYYHEPTRVTPDKREDLLTKFPHSPEPVEGLPRSGFRAISLNSQSIRPQVPVHNPSTSENRGMKASVDQASVDVLQIPDDHIRSGRLAERLRAKSNTSRSYTPAPPAPITHSPRPIISHSAHSSRVNVHHVPSHVAMDYREFLEERDPNVIRRMINQYPIAPLCSERTPEYLRPIRFDMVDPRYFQKTFREYVEMAVAQGRPLDARVGGPYRRIIDTVDLIGIIPETGSGWSRQVVHR
ncbi:uncharacterized protein BJ212DRAFT_1303385 [Suillus subaureus]|uniref:Uncharacterized protein n=1 Tax=Suillus subaureus TaxID=48587 RepID=A0A9P7E0H2_9AGAM|nr:uncharacterized protein BJ212DRAFT_1303385 [Suillus subaureus]KAG1807675.1 hypothetical protein BJ212DRAFT_1303385 [Suillus subaureus]